jgi:hypothetical protein
MENGNNFNSNYMQPNLPIDLNFTQTDLDLSFLQDDNLFLQNVELQVNNLDII